MDIVERLREGKSAGGYWREKEAADEIERLREVAKDRPKDRPNDAADEIERLQYALMKVCNSLDDNLPAIMTKNIALAALGLPLRGMKGGE